MHLSILVFSSVHPVESEEEGDRRFPDLIESAADDEVDDADVESAAGETDNHDADTT